MEVVSTRTFRCNQSAFLRKAKQGEDVLLTSRLGTFKLVPVTEEDALTQRAAQWVAQLKRIQDGQEETRPVEDLFNEL